MTDRSVSIMAATRTVPPRKPARSKTAAARPSRSARKEAGRGGRKARSAGRRDAILAAALEEFSVRGFEATRLDDVAKRAGVAKGTIYLHFKDKEALFEELIRTAIVPLVKSLTAGPPPVGASVRDMVEVFARTFIREVTTTRRGDIV